MFSKFFWVTFALLALADVVSYAATFSALATTSVGIALTFLLFVLTLRRPDFGFFVIVAELAHGSQGHLFEINVGQVVVPIRMAFFAAFLLAWLIKRRKPTELSVGLWWYVLATAVLLGVIVGLVRGNSLGSIFYDANAYGYLLLLFPAMDLLRRGDERFRERLLTIVVAAGVATALLTVVVHVLYALDVSFLRHVYVWIRDWGLGEVTPPGHAAFNRVFFQSYLWVLIAFLAVLSRHSHATKHGSAVGLLLATIFLSFSRSLWLGSVVGIAVVVLSRARDSLRTLAVAMPIALVIVALIAPQTFLLVGSRAQEIVSEPAAASRWNLLPVLWNAIKNNPVVGYGFGSTLTYTTKDPKLIVEFGTDQYTTSAFEWGYLEQWFKMGLLGLIAVVGLLLSVGRQISKFLDVQTRIWLLSSLASLVVIHIFSPYLNHPLGLGFLIIVEGYRNRS